MSQEFANNILILGSGGREHAMAYRCLQDDPSPKVFVMPGNPGMAMFHDITLIEGDILDCVQILKVIEQCNIDLVIIGPEAPLEQGVADKLREQHVSVVGTGKEGARLESSKAFSKEFMHKHKIPTAEFKVFSEAQKAIAYIKQAPFEKTPVVKASSLAGGKGVFVCETDAEAIQAVEDIMLNNNFSVSSNEVVIEERMFGRELSAFALYDGKCFKSIGYACDYKRLLDGDLGPNTGGMGTWTPDNFPNEELKKEIEEKVFKKVLEGLKTDGIEFCGILFAGLMIEKQGPKVIEFNVRFGDPESQVFLPLLKGNFTQTLFKTSTGNLKDSSLEMDTNKKAVHIVKASGNYPALSGEAMVLGQQINLSEQMIEKLQERSEILVFFAGVKSDLSSEVLVNSGGRVLGITAISAEISKARELAYDYIKQVNFEGQFYRKDIAAPTN